MKRTATPEMIAAAWSAWHKRHGGKLGPGPAFVEAINAALAADNRPDAGRAALERSEVKPSWQDQSIFDDAEGRN